MLSCLTPQNPSRWTLVTWTSWFLMLLQLLLQSLDLEGSSLSTFSNQSTCDPSSWTLATWTSWSWWLETSLRLWTITFLLSKMKRLSEWLAELESSYLLFLKTCSCLQISLLWIKPLENLALDECELSWGVDKYRNLMTSTTWCNQTSSFNSWNKWSFLRLELLSECLESLRLEVMMRMSTEKDLPVSVLLDLR